MKNKTLKIAILAIGMLALLGCSKESNKTNSASKYNEKINVTNSKLISIENAKAIALKEVSGATEKDIVKTKLDKEDGMMEYEVKIHYNNLKYEFDIDATTGDIVGREVKSRRNH